MKPSCILLLNIQKSGIFPDDRLIEIKCCGFLTVSVFTKAKARGENGESGKQGNGKRGGKMKKVRKIRLPLFQIPD